MDGWLVCGDFVGLIWPIYDEWCGIFRLFVKFGQQEGVYAQ